MTNNNYESGRLNLPFVGISTFAKKAYQTDKTVREICLEEKVLSKEKLKNILDPYSMISPNDKNKK